MLRRRFAGLASSMLFLPWVTSGAELSNPNSITVFAATSMLARQVETDARIDKQLGSSICCRKNHTCPSAIRLRLPRRLTPRPPGFWNSCAAQLAPQRARNSASSF